MMRRAWWAMALTMALAGCGSSKSKSKPSADQAAADQDAEATASGPATPSFGNPLGMMGSLLAKNVGKPGPYDEARESADFDRNKPHAAVLELEGEVSELESFSLWRRKKSVTLRAIDDKLRELAADDSVNAVLLRVGDLGLGSATAEELRASLQVFKRSGKTLACHVEGAQNAVYLLLSACDRLGLAPTGEVVVSGVAAMPIHLKGALDRLGVVADFLHVGAFKGAAEPLTRDRPSAEMVATLNAILDEAYASLVDGIAEGRKLAPDAVRGLIDRALFQGDEAKAAGLVDDVATFESFRDQVAATGWQTIKLGDEPSMSKLMELIGLTPRRRPSGDHLALVYAVGDVVDGKAGGVLGAREEIASRPLASALRVLAADDSVKAIVLRVDSPGGSALASELIAFAVREAAAKKPVVVSMGAVAASGGYYISCGATTIMALRNTLTGSIGVVGGKLAIGGALAKVGVKSFPMGRGKRALMWSSMSPWTADERAAIQSMMEATYQTFVARVAAGRKKSPAEIHAIGQGRVWTGAAALEVGLVDKLGNLDDALAEARKAGGLADDAPLEVYPPEATLLDYLSSLGEVSMPYGLGTLVAEVEAGLGPDAGQRAAHLVRQLLRFRSVAVQTVWMGDLP